MDLYTWAIHATFSSCPMCIIVIIFFSRTQRPTMNLEFLKVTMASQTHKLNVTFSTFDALQELSIEIIVQG